MFTTQAVPRGRGGLKWQDYNMTAFRQVIPSTNVTYLVWLSPYGGVRSYAFSHTENETENKHDNFIIETSTDIRSVPKEERKGKTLKTVSLEKSMFDYVKSISSSNRIWEVDKSNNLVPVAVSGQTITEESKAKDFSLKFNIIYKEDYILNV